MKSQIIYLLFFSFFWSFSLPINAQSDIAIGEWNALHTYSHARYVTQSTEKIFYGTELSVFTIDKEDNSIEYISKVEGLTETGIQHLSFDNFNNQLVIAYENSIVDLVSEDGVYPIFNLKDNTNFNNKKIFDTFIQSEKWLYFATGFGLVQYNLTDNEFGFTVDAKQIVNAVAGNSKEVMFAAADGVYFLNVDNSTFPNAFSEWKLLEDGLPSGYEPLDVLVMGNTSYIALENEVYRSDDFSTYELIYENPDPTFVINLIKETPEGWVLGFRGDGFASKVILFDNMDSPLSEVGSCTSRLRDVEVTEDGSLYFADDFDEIRFINSAGECSKEYFEGPFTKNASDISIKDGIVYVASGGVDESFAPTSTKHGFYIYDGRTWDNINQDVNPFFKDENLSMFYQIEAHPRDSILYVGTYGRGLIEYNYETGEQKLLRDTETDGALGEQVGNPGAIRITGLTFDDDENLWVSCFGAENPVAVKTSDGLWYNFSVNSDQKTSDLVVDNFGYVWVLIAGTTGGVNVIDPGESIADPTDDRPARFLNLNNSNIPSNIVNSIAKDLDGAIWIGTAEGVVTFECDGLDESCQGNRRTVLQDNFRDFLLRAEDVLTIEVDGANRKWFGTRNGIFVQDASGEVQVAKFDVDNSPLFDNIVRKLKYNPKTGEMFIITNKGMQSFRTASTGARTTHSGNVYAFPNPVRPEHTGPIAIKGLAQDAEVHITDIDGQLVYKTEALGGQAIWDGRDLNAQDVAGGVYLVFSSSRDNFTDPDTYVTKILVVR